MTSNATAMDTSRRLSGLTLRRPGPNRGVLPAVAILPQLLPHEASQDVPQVS